MKQLLIAAAGLLIAFIAARYLQNPFVNASDAPKSKLISAVEDPSAQLQRGAYLVTALVCDDCHTPKKMTEHGPEPDLSRRLMGHPASEPFIMDEAKAKLIREQNVAVFSAGLTGIAGPWGVSYAANLTPDDTGIGTWTEAQFIKAIREGKSKGLDGTRPLLPPMPWQQYRNLSDDDLKAIFAFIRTLKPVQNAVPNPIAPRT